MHAQCSAGIVSGVLQEVLGIQALLETMIRL